MYKKNDVMMLVKFCSSARVTGARHCKIDVGHWFKRRKFVADTMECTSEFPRPKAKPIQL
jgi:hypothetical protein